ncbi:MAG: TPM domain-containing protein [Chitinophagaceae bacterium]|jgi:uncharacterized protein
MMNKYLLAFLLFIGAMGNNAFASDKDFPEVPNPPRLVNDFAGFLKGSEEEALELKLRAYNDSTSSQIAIVTIESIGQYDVSDYTIQLFNKWKIGGKKNNNGILILAAKDERKIWITTGYGLEGALPDGLIGQLIRDHIEPNFKEGKFYEGFDEGIDAIILAARGEYKAEPKAVHKKGGGPGTAVLILIVIFVFIAISRGGRGGGGGGLLNSAGWIAASMLSNRSSSDWGGSSGGWGGGSSGGGGFGGFGGGSSGGGGAGGSW